MRWPTRDMREDWGSLNDPFYHSYLCTSKSGCSNSHGLPSSIPLYHTKNACAYTNKTSIPHEDIALYSKNYNMHRSNRATPEAERHPRAETSLPASLFQNRDRDRGSNVIYTPHRPQIKRSTVSSQKSNLPSHNGHFLQHKTTPGGRNWQNVGPNWRNC